MSWLDPLLEQIMYQNDPQAVEAEVRMFMGPIARDVQLQAISNTTDSNGQKGIANDWLRNQVDAAIQLSAVSNKSTSNKEKK